MFSFLQKNLFKYYYKSMSQSTVAKGLLFFLLLFFNSQNIFSQAEAVSSKDRASVALVLGGGGAKGFGIIPVLEVIDELGIPIDMVIGNSAGAIIGGLYSIGYTPEEIRQ